MLVLTASATVRVGVAEYGATLGYQVSVNADGKAGATESHLVVRRNVPRGTSTPAPALILDARGSGPAGVQVNAFFGPGFRGVRQVTIGSQDGVTLYGTIDGRAIARHAAKADPKSITLADGEAIPATGIDEELRKALQVIAEELRSKCAQASRPSEPLGPQVAKPRPGPGGSSLGAHAHASNATC